MKLDHLDPVFARLYRVDQVGDDENALASLRSQAAVTVLKRVVNTPVPPMLQLQLAPASREKVIVVSNAYGLQLQISAKLGAIFIVEGKNETPVEGLLFDGDEFITDTLDPDIVPSPGEVFPRKAPEKLVFEALVDVIAKARA